MQCFNEYLPFSIREVSNDTDQGEHSCFGGLESRLL